MRALNFGLIRNSVRLRHAECLTRIYGGVQEFLEEFQPDSVAIEGIFYCKNIRTAIALGQARGAVISACGERPVYEYAPRLVKQAVTGSGRAHKQQVVHMVVSLLGLSEEPAEDAADALAIAITHATAIRRPEVNRPKRL